MTSTSKTSLSYLHLVAPTLSACANGTQWRIAIQLWQKVREEEDLHALAICRNAFMTCLARAARNSVGLHFKLFRKGFPDENFYLFQAMKAYAFNEPLKPPVLGKAEFHGKAIGFGFYRDFCGMS
eukprot:symbB.v1.2.007912.t1/scaffold494.1/size196131/6